MNAEEMTAGGIYIPDMAKEKPQEAVVEAVSETYDDEAKKVLEQCQPGTYVLVGKYGGTTIVADGQELKLVEYRDVLAVIGTPKKKSSK